MKTKTWLTISIVVLLVFAASAQKPASDSALHSMVATERAFSQASAEKGTRDSFMMFIAEDGILFRPTAVIGKKWLQQHPVPFLDNRPLLAWQPIFADMSAAGDMGYTFGPWEYKQSIKDQKPAAYGHFATIWKKQTDGSWKFAIDLGISHPQSATPDVPWLPEKDPKPVANQKIPSVDIAATREALSKRDREFSTASVAQGTREAFHAFSADHVRLFRNEHLPFVGKDAIAEALNSSPGVLTWQPIAADVSRSGDLGYTYGLYELRSEDAGKSLTGNGNYMRFWKKQNGAWKVVLDMSDPLPLTSPPGDKKN